MRLFIVVATALLAGAAASGQSPATGAAGKAGTIGFMHAIHSTNDIDATLAFYQARTAWRAASCRAARPASR